MMMARFIKAITLLITIQSALSVAETPIPIRGTRQAESGRVGSPCSYNTDCLSGSFCNAGQCYCLSTFVSSQNYCYQKLDPSSAGCVVDIQCSSTWPDAFCDLSAGVGTCKCGENKIERATRDGYVCIDTMDVNGNTLAISCPLPEGAGYTSALSDPHHPRQNDGPGPVLCNTLSTKTSQTIDSEEIGNGDSGCLMPSDNSYMADIFDCVEFISDMDLTSSGYDKKANGVCCPNRSYLCNLPSATGPNPSEPRWSFSSITGSCHQFLWDPFASGANDHSANNFRTSQHCMSFCGNWCQKGVPEYEVRNSFLEETPLTTCSATSYEPKSIGAIQLCCPSLVSLCGPIGGRPLDPSNNHRDSIYHQGSSKQGAVPTTRFYYNNQKMQCLPFLYNGVGGNFNRFSSRVDCEIICSSKLQCENGSPLKVGENTQACSANNDCPSGYECHDGRHCCPTMQNICSQPLRLGNCDRSIRSYWYDQKQKACSMFLYTGCQGNDNRFDTLLACQQYCSKAVEVIRCPHGTAYKDLHGNYMQCGTDTLSNAPKNYEKHFEGTNCVYCPTKQFTCSLSPDAGKHCGPGVSYRFYYDQSEGSCKSFSYNGCDGGSNNFATRDECDNYCGMAACKDSLGTPLRDNNNALISCDENAEKCGQNHECVTVFGGVLMSSSKSTKTSRCCPTRSYICSMPPQMGSSLCSNGISPTTKYYYNKITHQCSTMMFNGCQGNANRFDTLQACKIFCTSASCASGEIVYVNPNTQEPLTCDGDMQNNCPESYRCTKDNLSDISVCCGAPDLGVCPITEKPYMNAIDGTVRECFINEPHSCPDEFLCRFSQKSGRYYCCKSKTEVKSYCMVGRIPYRDHAKMLPIRCTMNSKSNGCPERFICHSTFPGALQGFCCSVSDICAGGLDYYVEEDTKMPRVCTVGYSTGCPNAYHCKSNGLGDGTEGYCCEKGRTKYAPPMDGCPLNQVAYIVAGSTVPCNPFNFDDKAGQPKGYTCQWSVSNQRYQYCGLETFESVIESKSESDGCPPNQIAFINQTLNGPQTCASGVGNTCPVGYFCLYSSLHSQFQCCGVHSDCPRNSVAFIGLSGDPQTCSLGGGSTPCPDQFSCVKSRGKHDLCCAEPNPCQPEQIHFNGECFGKAVPGEKCLESRQCLGKSTCRSGFCMCTLLEEVENGHCVPIKKKQIEPVVEKIEKLECPEHMIEVESVCLEKGQINSSCSSTKQCIHMGATCHLAKCSCPKYMTFKGDQCEVDKVSSSFKRKMPKKNGQKLVSINDVLPSKKSTIKPVPKVEQMCPNNRKQVLVNGRLRTCLNGGAPCPTNSKCMFSAKGRKYYCCGSVGELKKPVISAAKKPIQITKAAELGCSRGKAVVYQNGSPMECNYFRKCAAGASCLRSVFEVKKTICCKIETTKSVPTKSTYARYNKKPVSRISELTTKTNNMLMPSFQKMTTPSSKTTLDFSTYKMINKFNELVKTKGPTTPSPIPYIPNEIYAESSEEEVQVKKQGSVYGAAEKTSFPCPSYMVLLELRLNEKTIKRCQHACPVHMTPVKGICRIVEKKPSMRKRKQELVDF